MYCPWSIQLFTVCINNATCFSLSHRPSWGIKIHTYIYKYVCKLNIINFQAHKFSSIFDGNTLSNTGMSQHNRLNSIKIVTAIQASIICKYKNLKHKILKYNGSIYFNKQYLNFNLTPKSANIRIKNTSLDSKYKTNTVRLASLQINNIQLAYIVVF